MKNFISLSLLMLCFMTMSIAQDFKIVDSVPLPLYEYEQLKSDTVESTILYEGQVIKGYVTNDHYECVYDSRHQIEGQIFSKSNGIYDQNMNPLDVTNVVAVKKKEPTPFRIEPQWQNSQLQIVPLVYDGL